MLLIILKVVSDENVYIHDVCVWVCVPLASDSWETIEATIIKLGMITASQMLMHCVLIILTLTFIQGHTDINHKNNKCLIISEIIQAMPISFTVKIVQLKVYMTIASPMTLTFKVTSVSNLTT